MKYYQGKSDIPKTILKDINNGTFDELMRLKAKQRTTLKERLKMFKLRVQNTIFKQKIDNTIRMLDQLNTNYAEYDNGKRNLQYTATKDLPYRIQKSLQMIQNDSCEWAGGINLKEKTIPGSDKIVMRRGITVASRPDSTSDIEFHTHPDRLLTGNIQQEKNFDNLAKKYPNNPKIQRKIHDLKTELNKSFDFIPSASDLNYIRDSSKPVHQTLLTISKENIAVSSKTKTAETTVDVPDDYHLYLIHLAAKRTLNKPPQTVKEAEKMVKNYKLEVKRGFQSVSSLHGVDSTIMNKKNQIKYRLPSNSERIQRRNQANPEEQYDFDIYPATKIKNTKNNKKPGLNATKTKNLHSIQAKPQKNKLKSKQKIKPKTKQIKKPGFFQRLFKR